MANRSRSSALRRGNVVLALLLSAHTADHLVRHPGGRRRTSPGQWSAATALFASVAGAFALAASEGRRAPVATAAMGLASSAGPLLAHGGPHLGPLSHSCRGGADALSWALLLAVAAAGAGAGVAGLKARSQLHSAGASQPAARPGTRSETPDALNRTDRAWADA